MLRIRTVAVLFASLGLVVAAASSAFSGDDKPGEEKGGMPQMTPDMLKAMQECLKNMEPGEPHKLLGNFVGSWKTTSKMWMMGESGPPPLVTNGTSEVKWVLGGHYIMEEHRGEVMMPDADMQMKKKAHEGISMVGYDNNRNLYTGTWADNLGTAMMNFKGAASPDGKTITMYGEMDEPMVKVYGRYVKFVHRILSKDKHVFELYDLHAGDNYKVIEVTYERK